MGDKDTAHTLAVAKSAGAIAADRAPVNIFDLRPYHSFLSRSSTVERPALARYG